MQGFRCRPCRRSQVHGARRPKAAHCHLHVIALCYYRSAFYSGLLLSAGLLLLARWRSRAPTQLQLSKQLFSSHERQGHRRSLQRDSAEKFARAGPNDLHAEAKQDKGSEPDENVRTYGSKQSRNSI